MDFGLYAAYLGMRARQRNLDSIANNIANASTTGFKADRLLFRSVEAAVREEEGTDSTPGAKQAGQTTASSGNSTNRASQLGAVKRIGVETGQLTDFSNGAIRETGRPLDLALNGEGFIVVQTENGERYTRAGALKVDADGQLVTMNGELVVGEGGPITLSPGQASIGEDGTVSSGDQKAGRLKIVNFSDPRTALIKDGPSLFAATGTERPQEAANTQIVQGALEMSNVNTIEEMAAMIQNNREFDSLQKSLSMMMNDLGRKVSNELGRI